MTLHEHVSAVADLMASARRLGDLYIASRASYGRSVAIAERIGTDPLRVTACGRHEATQDAYESFYFRLQDVIDVGQEAWALELNRTVLGLADEAHRVALVRECRRLRTESN